jgi:hypothetical protein
MGAGEALSVTVEIASDPDADAARLDELTRSLRRELFDLDVEAVERVEDTSTPPGAKVGEVLALGALVITVAKKAGSVAQVVKALQGWTARGGRSVKLDVGGDTIEITGASRAQQDQLIAAWIERHANA